MIYDPKPHYQQYGQNFPQVQQLLEPRRFVVDGPASAYYPNCMNGFVCDFLNGILDIDLLLEEADQNPEGFADSNDYQLRYVHLVAQREFINCQCPTYFLGADIGEALLATEPPGNIPLEDIRWPHSAFRVYLPTNWMRIESQPVLYLDIALIANGDNLVLHEVAGELARASKYAQGRVPEPPNRTYVRSLSLGIAVERGSDTPNKQHGLCPWDSPTLNEMMTAFSATPHENREEVTESVNLMRLAINIVMLLGHAPDEVSESVVLRKPKTNGSGEVIRDGLWSPRFIGRPTFKDRRSGGDGESSGRQGFDQVRKGHWRRHAHGPGRGLRKVIWVSLYRTRSREERGLPPE